MRPADFKSAASADFAIRASALPRGGSVHAGSAVAFIVSARTENRGPRRVSIPRHLDSPVNLMVKGGSLGRCLSEMRTIALHQEAAFLQNCPAGPIAARLTEPILRGLCTLHVPGCRVNSYRHRDASGSRNYTPATKVSWQPMELHRGFDCSDELLRRVCPFLKICV